MALVKRAGLKKYYIFLRRVKIVIFWFLARFKEQFLDFRPFRKFLSHILIS